MPVSRIRNFSIIAHIDHGKVCVCLCARWRHSLGARQCAHPLTPFCPRAPSPRPPAQSTLADTLLLRTGTLAARDAQAQYLDSMPLERERGITIKLNTARMHYFSEKRQQLYVLNLIDTPGHVDFSYEVSRSLAACEGALLVVDASQGVEAQTVANVLLAFENNLEVVPVLNKIDLPGAEVERVKAEVSGVLGLDTSTAILASAKQKIGIDDILEAIVDRVPPPQDTSEQPLRALVFDSYYDSYRGVVVLFRVVDGLLKVGDTIRMMNTGAKHTVTELGVFSPTQKGVQQLGPGDVGWFAAAIKAVADARVGDTVTLAGAGGATEALPGYAQATPMVFCGLFPTNADEYPALRESLGRLQLNDAALRFEPETSSAMGFGFRCGFLGLLHLEIIQERLSREFNLDLIATAPSVIYKITLTNGEVLELHNPADMPDPVRIESIAEPWIKATIFTPDEYLGAVIKLCQDRRGSQRELSYVGSRAMVVYDLPLNEVVFDFYDRLKSISKGYASFDYQLEEYRTGDLVKMSILVNAEPVDALSMLVHRNRAEARGRSMCEKMKDLIPPHMFVIPIQAAIGGKIIARETVRALRKDVTAKCYGGDASRKRKLLDKQKEGKKRLRQFGKVEIPQEAFIAALKMDDD